MKSKTTYYFTALDSIEREVTGGVEAQSEEDAILDLREQGLYPTHLSREKVYQSVMRTKLFHFIAQTWDCLVFSVLTSAAISLAVFLCYVVSLMYKVIITSNLREPIVWIGVCGLCGALGSAIYKIFKRN